MQFIATYQIIKYMDTIFFACKLLIILNVYYLPQRNIEIVHYKKQSYSCIDIIVLLIQMFSEVLLILITYYIHIFNNMLFLSVFRCNQCLQHALAFY